MTKEARYSEAWTGQDGNKWREVSYWIGDGWKTFLQFNDGTGWRGW